MKYVIIDPVLSAEARTGLQEHGYTPLEIQLDASAGLDTDWKGHPDIHFVFIRGTLFYDPSLSGTAETVRASGTIHACVCGERIPVSPYPSDCAYNILFCGDYVFHNFKYTDPVLLRALEKDFKCINIKQGYANCSSIALCDRTTGRTMIASSDKGVLNAAKKNNIETLYVENTGIILGSHADNSKQVPVIQKNSRMKGFWGGCCGTCGDTVYFTGDPGTAKEGRLLMDWITTRGYKIVILSHGPCVDTGSLLFCV